MKILIADDNPLIRKLYSLEFEGEGFDVVLAENGAQALDLCREHAPDAVVLDIGMPEQSGLDVLSELASMHGGTPVVVNTAYPLFRFDYRAHRASAWIEKGSNLDPLKKAVLEVISRNRETPAPEGEGETQ